MRNIEKMQCFSTPPLPLFRHVNLTLLESFLDLPQLLVCRKSKKKKSSFAIFLYPAMPRSFHDLAQVFPPLLSFVNTVYGSKQIRGI